MQHATAAPPAASRRRTALRIAALVLGLAVLVVLGRSAGRFVPAFAERVHALGPWGPVAFIAGYVVAAVAFVPGSLLTLAAGAIFGLARGTAYVFVGATLGAAAAFLVSRYAARSLVERRVARDPRFAAVDRAIATQGRKIVFLLRLSPVFPFNALNYALGLTRVRFVDYVLASVGMLPGTVLFVYYGKLAGDVAALAGGAATPKSTGYWVVLGVGLLATVVVTTIVTRLARRALGDVGQAPPADAPNDAPATPPPASPSP